MAVDRELVLKIFAAVGAGLVVLGCAEQDWQGNGGGLKLGSKYPGWGTCVTAYVLGVEAALVAFVPLGSTAGQDVGHAYLAGYALVSVSCLVAGLLHSFVSPSGSLFVPLTLISLLSLGLGSLAIAYVGTATAQNGGHLKDLPQSKTLLNIFGGVGAVWAVVVVLSQYFVIISIPGIVVAVPVLFCGVWLVVVGFISAEPQWPAGVLVTFAAAVFVRNRPLDPFTNSATFDCEALSNAIVVLYTVATVGLIGVLVKSQSVTAAGGNVIGTGLHNALEALPLKSKNRRCCEW